MISTIIYLTFSLRHLLLLPNEATGKNGAITWKGSIGAKDMWRVMNKNLIKLELGGPGGGALRSYHSVNCPKQEETHFPSATRNIFLLYYSSRKEDLLRHSANERLTTSENFSANEKPLYLNFQFPPMDSLFTMAPLNLSFLCGRTAPLLCSLDLPVVHH